MKLHSFFESLRELRTFLLLFTTQALSSLGSAMTSYALVIWAYQQSGSALSTALLTVSSYAPYVVFSLLCGALVDRLDTRRTMLVSDALAACTTVVALVLLQTERLQITHLYLLNALNGLMNTLQQPASEAATTALLPKSQYQRVGGLRYLSSSLSGLLTPVLAMALRIVASDGRDRPASGEAVSLGAGLFAAGEIAHADSATPTSADEKRPPARLQTVLQKNGIIPRPPR